jgi:hypothetical protein
LQQFNLTVSLAAGVASHRPFFCVCFLTAVSDGFKTVTFSCLPAAISTNACSFHLAPLFGAVAPDFFIIFTCRLN